MMTKDQIKELRLNLGLTQKGMSEALGCAVSSIEHYEQGVRKPSKVFMEKLEDLKRIQKRIGHKKKVEIKEEDI
jgi:transcriptional regulator with XRE-family HTH domain